MLRKLLGFTLVIAFLSGCATPPVSSVQPTPARIELAPVVEESTVEPIVSAGTPIVTSDGDYIATLTSVPLPVATPVLQGEFEGLKVYYLYEPIDFQTMQIAFIALSVAFCVS